MEGMAFEKKSSLFLYGMGNRKGFPLPKITMRRTICLNFD